MLKRGLDQGRYRTVAVHDFRAEVRLGGSTGSGGGQVPQEKKQKRRLSTNISVHRRKF